MFLCAWFTDFMGLDAIFGAFIFGLIVPRESKLFHECETSIEPLVLTFTLPLYFALSGLKTDVTQLDSNAQGAMVVLVCFVASVGKLVGCGVPALIGGMSFRESATIAVLMNTRGLVELIVLNLGLSAGILSTKTFSVMVIMCLFTTFITGPIVEYIYPPHLRGLLPDKAPEDALLANKGDDADEDDLHVDDVSLTVNTDIVKASQSINVAMVLDRFEELQGSMNLVSLLAPVAPSSELSVRILKFAEPLQNDQDDFVGLSEQGKLIHVAEVDAVENIMNHRHLTEKEREATSHLLPISMLCKSVGVTATTSFSITGNPLEFPGEVKELALDQDLVVFPWRTDSAYVKSFFWGTWRKVPVTIALFAQVGSAGGSNTGIPAVLEGGGRGRSDSIAAALALFRPNAGPDSPSTNEPFSRRQSAQLQVASAPLLHDIHHVCAIITGAESDVAILTLLLRLLDKSFITATVFLVGSRTAYPVAVNVAISAFKRRIGKETPKVEFVKLSDAAATDGDAITSALTTYPCEVALVSFVEPLVASEGGEGGAGAANITPTFAGGATVRARSNTLSAFLALNPGESDRDGVQSSGAPSWLPSVDNAELGAIGSRLYANGDIANVIVLHEPYLNSLARRRRAATVQSGDSQGVDTPNMPVHSSQSFSSLPSDEQLADSNTEQQQQPPPKVATV